MKKGKSYSAQFKNIPEQLCQNQIQNHPNKNPEGASHKKIAKDIQEFIINIAASGFKQFHAFEA